VSEFLDGPNLNQWIADRTITWAEAVRLTAAMADALAYAHSRSTIHRDLKPGNVILVQRADGLQPVLVDFGLALDESVSNESQRGVIAGTPNYTSPEQTRGEGHRIDGRTDIYALGTILYRLLCGRLPFTAPTVSELLRKVVDEEPVPPRQLNRTIPRELERICLKAMSKRIADRHTTAADLAADLRDLLTAKTNPKQAGGGESIPRLPVRRHVSIMACRHDLLQSLEFVEALEPDEQFDWLTEFQRHCGEAAIEFGGLCAERTGECVLVCFGFPIAQEDAARRAVGAGLALRDRLRPMFDRLGRDCGFRPSFRIGIHTGPVVAADEPDPSRNDFLITGEARHVADWLARTSEGGGVTASGESARLTVGFFTTETVGRGRPPGAGRNLDLFRVLALGDARSRLDVGERAGLTPLVGRDTELDMLKDLWEQAKEGYGQTACLIGEAGLGKSRLVRELSEHLAGDGGRVIEWRASALFSNTGLYPAAEWISRTLGFDRLTAAERLDRLIAHLTETGIDSPEAITLFAALAAVPTDGRLPPLALSPMKMLEKTRDALLHYLRRQCDLAPVLFVVEDLHWLDPTSLEFLARLANGDGSGRMVTLFTFRPEFVTPWAAGANHTHLALNRLTTAQVEDMLRKRTGLDRVPKDLVAQMVERTEGVPLFIEEYATLVTESGALRHLDGRTVLADGFSLQTIPATLQDLLVSRLDRLKSVRDVAQLGSALGRRFNFGLLRAVSGLDDGPLRTELDRPY
jgi:class 3 adenylate cyclase